MEVKYKLVPVEPNDEQQLAGAQAIRIETTPINKMFTANRVYRDMIAAIPDQPSDLEIVQKALEQTGLSLGFTDTFWIVSEPLGGAIVDGGSGINTLLTWAKQQIGE